MGAARDTEADPQRPFLLPITGRQLEARTRIVCVLTHLHSLRFAPMIPSLARLLLEYLTEAEAFAVLEALVTRRGVDSQREYLLLSWSEDQAFYSTFLDILHHRAPNVANHIRRLGPSGSAVMVDWFRCFFHGLLPHSDALCIVDAFLSEGNKILIRIALAWCMLCKDGILACRTGTELQRALVQWVERAGPGPTAYTYQRLASKAFSIRALSRDVIYRAYAEHLEELRRPIRDDSQTPAAEAGGGGLFASFLPGFGSTKRRRASLPEADTGRSGPAGGGSRSATEDPDSMDGLVLIEPEPDRPPAAAATTTTTTTTPAAAGTPANTSVLPGSQREQEAAHGSVWNNPKVVGVRPALLPLPHPRGSAVGRLWQAGWEVEENVGQGGGLSDWVRLNERGSEEEIVKDEPNDDASASVSEDAVPRRTSIREATGSGEGAERSGTDAQAQSDSRSQLPSTAPGGGVGILAPVESYAVAMSPSLATLAAKLPERAHGLDWKCVYTTSTHGWGLETFRRHTRGLAPMMVVLRAGVARRRAGRTVMARGEATSSSASSTRGGGSEGQVVPTFGFFCMNGVPAPRFGGSRWQTQWYGSPQDLLFQLEPKTAFFPVDESERSSSAERRDGSKRFALTSSQFVLPSSDHLCIGGQRGKSDVAIRIPADMHTVSMSKTFLRELGVLPPLEERTKQPGTSASIAAALEALEVGGAGGGRGRSSGVAVAGLDEMDLTVLGCEAFAFVNRSGAIQVAANHARGMGTHDNKSGRATAQFIARMDEQREREREAYLATRAAEQRARDAIAENEALAREAVAEAVARGQASTEPDTQGYRAPRPVRRQSATTQMPPKSGL